MIKAMNANEFATTSRLAAAEGAVLLRNDQENLPLSARDQVAIFGRIQLDWYRSGTGSGGSVNVAYTTNLLDSLMDKGTVTIDGEVAEAYRGWIKDNPADYGDGGWASEPWFQKEMPLDDELVAGASKKNGKAIVVIGRTAGEDQDNKDEPGSYRLTDTEKEMLGTVCKYFNKVIIVLNVSNIIDMGWINTLIPEDIALSLIYVWQGGMEGGNAAADILVGDVVPSGKLTDTIAKCLEDYPSAHNHDDDIRNFYQEDIYVGYRYFETFCPEKVLYEFGHGLSYTDFEIACESGEINVEEGRIDFEVTVTNTGHQYSGQEVVQLYYEAPQGKLGKPLKVLGAFAKTGVLKPGEKEVLRLTIVIKDMASYDDSGQTGHKSCFVLEPGTYKCHVGNSVKHTVVVPVGDEEGYLVPDLLVTDQLEEVMAPQMPYQRMKVGAQNDQGSYELSYEDAPQISVNMVERIQNRMPKYLEQTGDMGYRLQDVAEGHVPLEAFISQLNDQDLTTIVRGEGMGSPWVTQGTASAFGALSQPLRDFGIPIGCTADGPSGIRMEGGHHATQMPIGACLAATWNLTLVEEIFKHEGLEMLDNGIDVLLGPGMNIKRHPLNGRNFEYFSEDPLITGKIAAVTVKGIHESGCHATLKHFICNNQERVRKMIDAAVSERALREIYLKGFEIAVKEGEAKAIMTAYNPINGQWTASNYDLNTTVLRKEWGFDGIVMTDWWATMNDPVLGGEAKEEYTNHMVRSQNDVYMVVGNFGAEVNLRNDNLMASLKDGSVTRGELQRSAMNICRFLMETPAFKKGEPKERVTSFEALDDEASNRSINDQPEVMICQGETNGFFVKTAGDYRVVAKVRYDASGIAQSECNVMLNGKLMSLIQVNGTDGAVVTRKLNKIHLEAGAYELELAFISAGLVVESLAFVKE